MPVSPVETSAFNRAQSWVRRGEQWGTFVLPVGKTVMERSYTPRSFWEEPRVIRMMVIQNLAPSDLLGPPMMEPTEAELEYRELYMWLNDRKMIRESFRPRRGSLWLLATIAEDEAFEFKMRWL